AVELVHVRVPSPGALVEAPRHVEILVRAVEGIPVVGMPEATVHEIGADEGTDGTQLTHAAHQLATGEMHIVNRPHGNPRTPLRAVARELVHPVVISLA